VMLIVIGPAISNRSNFYPPASASNRNVVVSGRIHNQQHLLVRSPDDRCCNEMANLLPPLDHSLSGICLVGLLLPT